TPIILGLLGPIEAWHRSRVGLLVSHADAPFGPCLWPACSPYHPRSYGIVGRLVDQDEASRRVVVIVAIGKHGLRQLERYPADVVHRQRSDRGLARLRMDVPAIGDALNTRADFARRVA